MSDRHQVWRLVEADYRRLKEVAPEGFEPIVLVYLIGRVDPVEIGWIETRDAAHGGVLVRLEALNRKAGERTEDVAHPDDYWVHLHESFIERVEISFQRKGASGRASEFGFSNRTASDAAGKSSA
jgi:hypothetical protein